MANTFERLASATLGSNTTTITFSSISQDYTDLVLYGTIYASTTGNSTVQLVVNGGPTYTGAQLAGSGSAVAGNYYNNRGTLDVLRQAGASAVIGAPTWLEVNFLGYSSTVQERFKCVLAKGGSADTGGVEYDYVGWNLDSTAITSIQITSQIANYYATGTVFSLYGIKRA